jgi:hypothetical protein
VLAIFCIRSITWNLAIDAKTQRENFQPLVESINSYSSEPSIIMLQSCPTRCYYRYTQHVNRITDSHAIVVSKFWIYPLNGHPEQAQNQINDVINQKGDLLLYIPPGLGTEHSLYAPTINQLLTVDIPDYVLNYYRIRSADVFDQNDFSYNYVLLEKRAQPLDPNFELNI